MSENTFVEENRPRNIFLLEPNYKNKYPPLGLMKLATYHKKLGDHVYFYKGKYSDFLLQNKISKCLDKMFNLEFEFECPNKTRKLVEEYIRLKHTDTLAEIMVTIPHNFIHTVRFLLKHYAYSTNIEKEWDRVYITTLFTFQWKDIKEAFEFAKKIVREVNDIYIGGVAASLIPDIMKQELDIPEKNVIVGLLDEPGRLDDNIEIIDNLDPDYSILETIDYNYSLYTGYLGYMTRGCTRSCKFCAVPKLEPNYKEKITLKTQIAKNTIQYGDRKDLILLDNNVLGSPLLEEIVQEIIDIGFTKESTYIEPNQFLLFLSYIEKEKNPYNKKLFLNKLDKYLFDFAQTRIRKESKNQEFKSLLINIKSKNGEVILAELHEKKDEINDFIETYRNKSPKKRFVDFNQGIDCRYINEENMELLSRIPIRPMRIAFDHISLKKTYINAIRLADKFNIAQLSNYILFNYNDEPIHLWERLKINVELNAELNASIFSFPMKFVPLYGEESLTRTYIGKNWNKKYIRSIRCILNVTRGIGMGGESFFYKAFGKTPEEYKMILKLPESYIIFRNEFEENDRKKLWLEQYNNLNVTEKRDADSIIGSNDFQHLNGNCNKAVLDFIRTHYQ